VQYGVATSDVLDKREETEFLIPALNQCSRPRVFLERESLVLFSQARMLYKQSLLEVIC
jgi:hypothetical protein